MNNVLRRLGSHWCVHVEASRRLATSIRPASFPIRRGNDRSGAPRFVHGGCVHFESQCFITFTYLPPAEGMTRLGDFFIDRPNNKVDGRVSYRAHFDHFLGQVDQIVNLMASFMPKSIRWTMAKR
jgi:type IV secretion system protein TrbE